MIKDNNWEVCCHQLEPIVSSGLSVSVTMTEIQNSNVTKGVVYSGIGPLAIGESRPWQPSLLTLGLLGAGSLLTVGAFAEVTRRKKRTSDDNFMNEANGIAQGAEPLLQDGFTTIVSNGIKDSSPVVGTVLPYGVGYLGNLISDHGDTGQALSQTFITSVTSAVGVATIAGTVGEAGGTIGSITGIAAISEEAFAAAALLSEPIGWGLIAAVGIDTLVNIAYDDDFLGMRETGQEWGDWIDKHL